MPNLSWKKAVRLAGLDLTDEERATDDWPDAFSLKQIAILQYPGDRTRRGGRGAQKDREALLEVLETSVKEGDVLTEQRPRRLEVLRNIPIKRCPHEGVDKPVSGVTNDFWVRVGGRFMSVQDFETVYCTMVLPTGLCDWFAKQGEAPSEHIQAWVGSFTTGVSEVKPDSQAGLVASVLAKCQEQAALRGIPFDVMDMPGQKRQFLDLLRRLEPSFKNMAGVQSLDRYLKGRCKWSLRSKSNPDATAIYQELFPEAWGNPGAVPTSRIAS